MTTKCPTQQTEGRPVTMLISDPYGIERYRWLVLRARLRLEVKGMTSRTPTAPAVRELIGSSTRSKKKLLAELEAWITAADVDRNELLEIKV